MGRAFVRFRFSFAEWGGLFGLVAVELAIGLLVALYSWKLAFGAVALFTVLLFIFKHPQNAYFLGILLLPFWTVTITGESQTTGVPEFRWADVAFILAGIGFVCRGLAEKNLTFRESGIETPLLAFFLWMVLSSLWSRNFGAATIELIRKTYGLAVFYLALNLVRDRSDLTKMINVWLLAALLSAVLGLYELFSQGLDAAIKLVRRGDITVWGKAARSSAFFATPNKLGLFLNISILLGLCQFLRTNNRLHRAGIVIAETIFFSALVCTLSRTSWITLGLGCFFLFLGFPKARKGMVITLIGGVVLFFLLTTAEYRELVIERMIGITDPGSTLSLVQRSEIWGVTASMISANPLTGIGIGNYYFAAQGMGIPEHLSAPHNLYFYLLSEFGLIGFSLFFVLVSVMSWQIIRGLKTVCRGGDRIVLLVFLIGFVMILVQSIVTSYVLREGELWAYWGIVMAAVRITAIDEGVSRSSTGRMPRKA